MRKPPGNLKQFMIWAWRNCPTNSLNPYALWGIVGVSGNVRLWRNSKMAVRWTAAGMLEAQKTFRRVQGLPTVPHSPQRFAGLHAKGSGRLRH